MPRANLDDTGHVQLGGFQPETGIDSAEQQDGEDNGKVSYEGPDLQKDEQVSKAPTGGPSPEAAKRRTVKKAWLSPRWLSDLGEDVTPWSLGFLIC